jgi:hypothetical protein
MDTAIAASGDPSPVQQLKLPSRFGAELDNPGHLMRGRKQAALTAARASAEHGHQERTPCAELKRLERNVSMMKP